MVNTLVLYDVARRRGRQRLDRLLRLHGFVWLFPHTRWSRQPMNDHGTLVRAIRARLSGDAYRIVFIEITQQSRQEARWMMASAQRPSR